LDKDGFGGGEPGLFDGGAACVDVSSSRAWVLIDDGSARRFGPALAWAWRHSVAELHVLLEGEPAAGVVARRAAEMAVPPTVWLVAGRELIPAVAAPVACPEPLDAEVVRYVEVLRAHGAEPVVEHGVLHGEVLGLEVAHVVNGLLEVGVGRHDRFARAEMRPGQPIGASLDETVASVRDRRRPGAAGHPANLLARSRWLRSVVCARPALVGGASLTPVAPPLPVFDLTHNGAVPSIGTGPSGEPVVVVCSTGVDLDLVPTAADSRRLYRPDAHLVIVVPEGDDVAVTRALAAALARPAEVRTVPRAWEGLALLGLE